MKCLPVQESASCATLHKFLGPTKNDGGSPLTGLIEVNGPLFGTSIVGSDVYAVTP